MNNDLLQSIGGVGVFALLVIKILVDYFDKKNSPAPERLVCGFPTTSTAEIKSIYEDNIRRREFDRQLLKSIEEVANSLSHQTRVLERLESRVDRRRINDDA